ncbi:hypothetical protein G9F71_004120 [Clostridium sp. FP2]|uniref:hypothetical protein n=1 Tax=Clostridium sp. FP2 TaxID=2724481 RepID=UPI00165225A1|nr:hypothetical protein [Clostridium sp. FP2]MBZ9622045.1 hypothetical protein [Clostridium sp. FP2]
MYIDEDSIRSYNQRYMYEPDTEYLPLAYQYRQIGPQGMPPSGPPNFTPTEPKSQQFGATPLAIDPGAIRPCIYRFVYIWPRRGNGFWAWLVFVGPRSVAGFRFNRNTWRYFGMDLRDIRSFQCF